MYLCKLCNFETNDKSNLNQHNKTKKHLVNSEIYKNNNTEEQKLIEKQNKEIEELKQKLEDIENQKKELEVTAKIYKELSEKAKNVNQGIIINNNLNYVNKHFKNAPPLKKISNYMINGIDLDDDTQIDKLTENIIYSYKNKCLHKFIGDHIIKLYKKDDLKSQSFHATDIARRKFLVKLEDNLGYLYEDSSDEFANYDPEKNSEDESNPDSSEEYDDIKKEYNTNQIITKKNKSKWTNDNEGIKISYLLLEPIMKKIIKQLKKKCKDYNKEMKKNIKKVPTKEETEIFEVLANILKELDKDSLKKNINNHIAPHFGLVKK
jgi:hypothetical protein